MARALYAGSDITALDTNGDPAPGAKLYAYLTGTTTPTSMYTAASGGTTHANPLVADSAGRFPDVFLDVDISYRMVLTNSAGSDTIYDLDPVKEGVGTGYATYATLAGAGGADLIGSAQGDTVQEIIDGLYLGLFTDFAGTPPAIPLVQLRVQTSGYGSVGVGAAWYVYDGTVNGAYVAANPRISFLDSLGRGWKIDARQELWIEMFGGIGDDVNDTLPALQATWTLVLRSSGTEKYVPRVHFGPYTYYFSGTINLKATQHLVGYYGGSDTNYGTILRFPADTRMLVINAADTTDNTTESATYGARGTIVQDITFKAQSMGTTVGAHGVWVRATAHLIRVNVVNAADNGFHLVGDIAGVGALRGYPFESYLEKCFALTCNGHALYNSGGDASVINVIGFKCREIGLSGIYTTDTFGSFFYGSELHGYANRNVGRVSHGGRHYLYIDSTTAGSSVTPGTNDRVWYDVGAGTSYPAWSGSGSYQVTLPVYSNGDSNRSCFNGCYVEGTFPMHQRGAGSFHGGLSSFTRYSQGWSNSVYNGQALASPRGWYADKSFYTSQDAVGLTHGIYFGGVPDSSYPGDIFRSTTSRNAGTHDWRLYHDDNGDMTLQEENQSTFMRLLGSDTENYASIDRTSASEAKGFVTIQKLAVAAPGEPAYRMIGFAAAAPGSGRYARGDIIFNVNATAGGAMGWMCVTAGSPGTWKAMANLAV